jgi:hypothetical protein
MSELGWIKLHRKLQKKGYYKKSEYIHLWVHLLLSANHKEKEFIQLYGRKDLGLGELVNMTDGGDGTIGRILSEELFSYNSIELEYSFFPLICCLLFINCCCSSSCSLTATNRVLN